ncbi:DUF397 domain-containing protein [Streptomyces echinoruber]|uniref:DUF397 domain-containing protein n=1 Tax=Streptomyces echinoruber TaxID=68898 RepID=A0A918QR90_9ACTN|nr:DUF397 domain-containing protein [Streptomyces echinoruber]GGZ68740.1 hypothetical protein GCM10010389_02470 [Streptomyces echinoruber]
MSVEDSVGTVPESVWVKSSHSSGEGGECVEIVAWTGALHVRDSKDKAGPVLRLTPGAWAEFVGFAARQA